MEDMDNSYWRLWPLGEIVRENTEVSEFGVLFGDYLIDCWRYRLRPVTPKVSAVYVDYYNDKDPIQVASSVHEFLEGLWRDSSELLERPLAEGGAT
jgi:hypothetical protein